MRWRLEDITFALDDDGTSDPVLSVTIGTPAGKVEIIASAELKGRTLCLSGLHVQGTLVNEIGPANIRVIAEAALERMGYDAIEIEGGIRTTGANPGRQPRPVRFARRAGAPRSR